MPGLQLSPEGLTAVLGERLTAANGRRRARTLSVGDLLATAKAAREEPWGFAFRHGGTVDDARARTTACLAVRTPGGVVVGVSECGAAGANPSRAWPELAPWSASHPAANVPRCEAWAARPREDRVVFSVPASLPGDDGGRLLARVLESPDDVMARRVYGDWLSERGDARGEWIAVQCALAELSPEDPRREPLLAKEAALREAHEERWLAELGIDAVSVRWDRGFIAELTLLAPAALGLPRSAFEREPISGLRIIDATRPQAELLSALPAFDRLRSLRFSNASGRYERALGAEGVAALLESRHLRALAHLAFEGQFLDDTGAMVLAQYGGPVFPALRSLRIAGDEVSSVGADVLSRAKWFRALETVELPRNALRGAEAVASLIDTPSTLKWKALTLDDNPLGDDGARAIAAATTLRGLERLSLERCGLKQPGVRALLDAPGLRELQALGLAGNRLDPLTEARWQGRFQPRRR